MCLWLFIFTETGSLSPCTAAHLVLLFIFHGLTSHIRVSHFSQWDLTPLETSWGCARWSSSYGLWHLHLLHNPKSWAEDWGTVYVFENRKGKRWAKSKRNSRSKWIQKIPFPHKFLLCLSKAKEGIGQHCRHPTAEQCSLRKGQCSWLSMQ